MSKELFNQMRELEAFELSATKKSCIEQGQQFIKTALNSGLVSKEELLAKALRYETFINEVTTILKNEFTQKDAFFGIAITPINGRAMVQFSEDEKWQQLSNQLKQREELLKVALKSDEPIYDSEGCEVPKVNIKYSKDSLQVKF